MGQLPACQALQGTGTSVSPTVASNATTNTPDAEITLTPEFTATPKEEDCLTTVYVGCNLPADLSAVPAISFPTFSLGTNILQPVYRYPEGAQLCVREIRGGWLRISEYNQFNRQTHWIYSFNPKNFSQRVIFERFEDTGCSSVVLIPTPTPINALTDSRATSIPEQTLTPTAIAQLDFEYLKCVLEVEAAYDPNQALDIAHVIRNRQKVSGWDPVGHRWQISAVDVVRIPAAFQAWRDRCQGISSYQTKDSRIDALAYQLLLEMELPAPTRPEIYSALFTWGEYAGMGAGGLSPDALDVYLMTNRGKDARAIVSESCGLVSDDNYIAHSGTSDAGYFTTFFSSDPGCSGG